MWLFFFFLACFSPKSVQALAEMEQALMISEFLPQPVEGSEWVELACSDEAIAQELSLLGYQLFDNKQKIASLDSEFCKGDFLLITVSGLNNDGDELRLFFGDTLLDSFLYDKSEKGLSYSRVNFRESNFLLGPSSPGEKNLFFTPTPTPTLTPSISENSPENSPSPSPTISPTKEIVSGVSLSSSTAQLSKTLPHYVDPLSIQLIITPVVDPHTQNRLVILQASPKKQLIQNAIMGSLLCLSMSLLLFYVSKKNQPHS